MVRISNFDSHRRIIFRALWIGILAFLASPHKGFCQSDPPKFEAAAQYVCLDYPSFDQTDSGLGGRFTYNFSRFLAVEGEFDLFPQKRPVLNAIHTPILDYINSRRMEGLVGVKAGIRDHRLGLFWKARPGFFYISKGERSIDPNVEFFRAPEEARGQFKFAMDLGVVVEVYTTSRTFIRIDAGDTMIKLTHTPFSDVGVRNILSHNLQLNIGLGFRF